MTQAHSIDARAPFPPAGNAAGVRQTAEEVSPPASSAVTILELPVPPSVNAMYRNSVGKGRVETQMYKDWKGHAGWRLRLQKPEPIHGYVVILINIERPNVASDVDNRIKALFDLLVTYGVITDDRFVVGFCAAWSPPANGVARVAIMPAHSFDPHFQLAPDGTLGGWSLPASQTEEDQDGLDPE